jgi:hypothetical protein
MHARADTLPIMYIESRAARDSRRKISTAQCASIYEYKDANGGK